MEIAPIAQKQAQAHSSIRSVLSTWHKLNTMEKIQSLCKQWATLEVSSVLLLPQDAAWLAAPLFTGLPHVLPTTTVFIPEWKQHHRMQALKQHQYSYIFPGEFCAHKGPFRL